MRSLSILILGLFITASASAQSDQSVRKEVEKAAATYAENYGKQNGAGMAALYARDGMLVNAGGAHTSASLAEFYAKSFTAGFNHVEISVDDASLLAPDLVVGRGEYTVSGQGPNGALQSHGRWTCVYVRENGALKIRLLTAFALPASK